MSALQLDLLSPWPKATCPQPYAMSLSMSEFKGFVFDTWNMKSTKMLANLTAVLRKYGKKVTQA